MKVVVLSSGGVDSTVCLAKAVAENGAENVISLSMFYGQKHKKELESARAVAEHFRVRHIERDLSSVFTFSDCSLLEDRGSIKHQSYADQLKEKQGTVDTYVPFRNGLFLSYATAIAYSIGARKVIYGAHADDAAGRAYPDCTPDFRDAMDHAIFEGTGYKVGLDAPLIDLNKSGVVALGVKYKAPFHLTWSCYEGGERACGTCGTCIDRQKAFLDNGMTDPILYEQRIGEISHFDPDC
jgi:7-cyano-7-deazaguanine synthase